MLGQTKITAILPVTKLEEAKRFYGETLGLKQASKAAAGNVAFEAGGDSRLELLPTESAKPSEHTAVTFEVQDVEQEVKDLEGRGVRFEDYDQPDLKTEGHIAQVQGEKAAWFKDPEGHILCIHQRPS